MRLSCTVVVPPKYKSSVMSVLAGCGYLARIRRLLSSPVLADTQQMAAPPSPATTDAILAGDRSWEHHTSMSVLCN